MKGVYVFFSFFGFFLIACGEQGDTGHSESTTYQDSALTNIEARSIIDDALINNILEEDLSLDSLQFWYPRLKDSQVLVQNEHVLKKFDTVLYFNDAADTIEIVKGQGNSFLKRLVLTSNRISVKNIKVGDTKAAFAYRFAMYPADTLIIQDQEASNTMKFIFLKDVLYSFMYDAVYFD